MGPTTLLVASNREDAKKVKITSSGRDVNSIEREQQAEQQ
jgi:hypothetical protein